MIRALTPNSESKYQAISTGALLARNSSLGQAGFSPTQICFGVDPGLPGDLLDDCTSVVANSLALSSPPFQRGLRVKQEWGVRVLDYKGGSEKRRASFYYKF